MSNFQYMGCYNDTSNRSIPNFQGNVSSVQECANIASAYGDNVIGLQYGGQCWTGTNLNQAMEYGPNNGNCGELGGWWTNQIYQQIPPSSCAYVMNPNELQCYQNNNPDLAGMNQQQLQQHWSTTGCNQQRNNQCTGIQTQYGYAPSIYNYIGCYADQPNRAVPNYQGTVSSVNECGQIAISNKQSVFAVQDGNQCFTSNEPEYATQYGYLMSNTSKCFPMGGVWANQVYVKNGQYISPPPANPTLDSSNFNTQQLSSNYTPATNTTANNTYYGIQT